MRMSGIAFTASFIYVFGSNGDFLSLKFKPFELKGLNDKTNTKLFENVFTYSSFKINLNFLLITKNLG